MTELCKSTSGVDRLLDRRDFLRLRKGKRWSTANIMVQMLASPDFYKGNAPRIGFTVTKKTGNAVERNRIKRRLRAAVDRTFPGNARPRHDYVFIARRGCLDCRFNRLEEDVRQALDQLHANRAKGRKNLPRN